MRTCVRTYARMYLHAYIPRSQLSVLERSSRCTPPKMVFFKMVFFESWRALCCSWLRIFFDDYSCKIFSTITPVRYFRRLLLFGQYCGTLLPLDFRGVRLGDSSSCTGDYVYMHRYMHACHACMHACVCAHVHVRVCVRVTRPGNCGIRQHL